MNELYVYLQFAKQTSVGIHHNSSITNDGKVNNFQTNINCQKIKAVAIFPEGKQYKYQ